MQYQERITSKGSSSSPAISLSSNFEPFVKDIQVSNSTHHLLRSTSEEQTLMSGNAYLKAKILEADQLRMALGLANLVVEKAKSAAKKVKNEDLANGHSTKALEKLAISLDPKTLNDLYIPAKYRKFLTNMEKYNIHRNHVAYKNHRDLARLLMDAHHRTKREQFEELFTLVIGKYIQQSACEKNDVLELFNV